LIVFIRIKAVKEEHTHKQIDKKKSHY